MVRMKSPTRGCSTFMTSAPHSPSRPAQNGAPILRAEIETVRPSSGAIAAPAARVPDGAVTVGSVNAGTRVGAARAGTCAVGPVATVPRQRTPRASNPSARALERSERRRGVVSEVVRHEVVAPRRALAHELADVVDRRLHDLGRYRRNERDAGRELSCASIRARRAARPG